MFSYDYPLYRPPSEAYSLILQVTLGCSHNGCTFCDMYKSKKFRIKSVEEIKKEIDFFRDRVSRARRIFLADGDALIIKTSTLLEILNYINEKFPERERISMYATPKSLLLKSEEELKLIREAGVELLYIGLESGDDELLKKVNKGVTSEEIILGSKKAKRTGFKISMTVIAGLAGNKKELSEKHMLKSAQVISEITPHYLGVLTLTLQEGTKLYDEMRRGEFIECDGVEILEEIKTFVKNIEGSGENKIVFRANHISNYLNLQGNLPEDREKILQEIDMTLRYNSTIERNNGGNL